MDQPQNYLGNQELYNRIMALEKKIILLHNIDHEKKLKENFNDKISTQNKNLEEKIKKFRDELNLLSQE